MFLHELPNNTFAILKAGTVITVVDPKRPDGAPFEVSMVEDRKILLGSRTTVFVDEATHQLFEQEKKKL